MRFPRTRFRTLLMVLLLLTGGAIINIAVALGCAIKFDYTIYRGSDEGVSRLIAPCWRITRSYVFGAEAIGGRADNQAPYNPRFNNPPKVVDCRQGLLSSIPPSEFLETGKLESVTYLSAGWPAFSLGYERIRPWRSAPGEYDDSGLPLPYKPRILRGGVEYAWPWDRSSIRFLPIGPLWPGFAINTLLYAAILWLLFATPGFVRRRIRINRGQCPACAYPIGSSAVCTECGAKLPSPSR